MYPKHKHYVRLLKNDNKLTNIIWNYIVSERCWLTHMLQLPTTEITMNSSFRLFFGWVHCNQKSESILNQKIYLLLAHTPCSMLYALIHHLKIRDEKKIIVHKWHHEINLINFIYLKTRKTIIRKKWIIETDDGGKQNRKYILRKWTMYYTCPGFSENQLVY